MSKKQSKAIRPKGFDDKWLQIDEFKDWLGKVDDNNNKYRCKLCKKTNLLSSSGKATLTEHAEGVQHKAIVKRRKVFFCPKEKVNMGESSRQGTLEETDHVKDISIIKAQVIWILKMIDSGYSNNSSDNIMECFKAMFSDSLIAQKIDMHRTKSSYIINHGLAPHFKKLLLEDINKSDILVLSFDESLNEITQFGQMDIMIRFWNNDGHCVQSRYLGSSFLGHAKSDNILEHVEVCSRNQNCEAEKI